MHGSASGHNQFKNDEKGFASLLKTLLKGSLVVMEATGYYHYRLAQFLYKSNVAVSVVNPLSVKRFIQMKLAKVKTDKSDARAICEYALANEVPLYNALTDVQSECLQLFRLLDSYLKKRTATKNKLHGEETLGIPSKFVHQSLKRNLKHLDKEISGIEQRLLSIVKERAATATYAIDHRSRDRYKDSPVFDRGDRWFFQVRDCSSALYLCGHYAHHPGIGQ